MGEYCSGWNAWTVVSQKAWDTTLYRSTQTDTPCHPLDLWPHDPISGMSPKDRLATVISIPDILLTVSQAELALGISPISWFILRLQ